MRSALTKTTPATGKQGEVPDAASDNSEVAEFLAKMKSIAPSRPRGACAAGLHLCHGRDDEPPAGLGHGAGLAGRHVHRRRRRSAGWTFSSSSSAAMTNAALRLGSAIPAALARLMTGVRCLGGFTQIRKVLKHARREAEKQPVNALVYVGDCMEENDR